MQMRKSFSYYPVIANDFHPSCKSDYTILTQGLIDATKVDFGQNFPAIICQWEFIIKTLSPKDFKVNFSPQYIDVNKK